MTTTATNRTYWSKDQAELPPYSDWKITFTKNRSSSTGDGDNSTKEQNDCNIVDDTNDTGDVSSSNRTTATYHVHRCMVGPRSEYFTRLFYQSLSNDDANDNDDTLGAASFSESHNRHSQIEFSDVLTKTSFHSIVTAFEMFLDYCYFLDKFVADDNLNDHILKMDDTHISPVALHFLCDYFQIQHEEFIAYIALYMTKIKSILCKGGLASPTASNRDDQSDDDTTTRNKKAKHKTLSAQKIHLMKDFIQKTKLKLEIARTQKALDNNYMHLCCLCKEIINFRSEGLNVETIQDFFAECCHKNKHHLRPGFPLAKFMDVPLWFAIASYTEENAFPKDDSEYWSENIAFFIDSNEIDETAFRTLTDTNFIPIINANAAVIFLKEEHKHGLHERSSVVDEEKEDYDVVNGDHDDDNDKVIDDTTLLLTNLQERCVDSFDLANLEQEDNEDLREKVLGVLSPSVMKAYLRKKSITYETKN